MRNFSGGNDVLKIRDYDRLSFAALRQRCDRYCRKTKRPLLNIAIPIAIFAASLRWPILAHPSPPFAATKRCRSQAKSIGCGETSHFYATRHTFAVHVTRSQRAALCQIGPRLPADQLGAASVDDTWRATCATIRDGCARIMATGR